MSTAEVSAVMDALRTDDVSEPEALFVGGCVRNALLGVEVEDVDIATVHEPDEVMARLEAAGIKAIPTGIEYGTVTAVIGDQRFEITTLRKDVETDGRRAVVAFTTDWSEDAQRRDFTMNTLLADQDGQVFDPTGDGVRDLTQRRVIFVGDASQRIVEDYLRILRFFRFHALYGKGEPDHDALKACEVGAGKIKTLSKERITQEFFKIISSDSPHEVLDLMFSHNILKSFNKYGYKSDFMRDVCTFQKRFGLGFTSSRLLVLIGLDLDHVTGLEEFLLIPKIFRRDMQAICDVLALPDLSAEHDVRVAVYKFGRVPSAQAMMIELAQDRINNKDASAGLEIIQNWQIPNFPVSGEDLIAQGHKPGPELGAELERMEEEWIARGFV